MADVSGKDLRTAERRMASIAHHLLPLPPPRLPPIRRSVTSANDNYRRVHREVSTREATWIPACDESGKEYTDIIYEKAVGEGIAKALRSSDGYADSESFGHLNVLDLQVQIRRLPKLVIAMVAAGYAVGGGHILHMVGRFDAGYGSSIMSRFEICTSGSPAS